MPVTEALFRAKNWITDWGARVDASPADNDTAIERAIAFVVAQDYGRIVIPPSGDPLGGVDQGFEISQKIDLPQGIGLVGEGDASILRMTTGMSQAAVSARPNCTLRDFQVYSTDSKPIGSRGIEVVGVSPADYRSRIVLDRVTVRRAEVAAYIDFGGVVDIRSHFIQACRYGLHYGGSQVNGVNVYGGEIHNCEKGVYIDSETGNNCHFWGGVIEGCSGYGVLLENTDLFRTLGFHGVYFESNDTGVADGYDIYVADDGFLRNLIVEDGFHFGGTNAIRLERCRGARIEDNTFQGQDRPIHLGALSTFCHVGPQSYFTVDEAFDPATDNEGVNNTWDNTTAPYWGRGSGLINVDAEMLAWLSRNPTHAHLTEGTYIASAELTTVIDQLITGDGQNKSIIKAAPGYAGKLLRLQDRVTVRDIGLQGVLESLSIGVEPLASAFGWTLQRVQIRSFDYGLKLDNANEDCNILNCDIRLNAVNGILISSTSGTPERVAIRDTRFDANTVGVHATGAVRALTLDSNDFEGGSTGVYLQGAAINGVVITGNRAKSNSAVDFRLEGASRGILFAGNHCDTTPTSLLLACTHSTFHSNVLNPATTTIVLGLSSDCDFGVNRVAAGTPAIDQTLVVDTRNTYLGKFYGTVAPAAGAWLLGDVVWNIDPDSADAAFWANSVAGSPGTFVNGPVYQ